MKGVLELNRINDLARNLLVRYYESCESLYRQGVELLVDSKQARKNADEPNPTAPGPRQKPGQPSDNTINDPRPPKLGQRPVQRPTQKQANTTNDPRAPNDTRKGGGTRKVRRVV